MTDYDCTSDVLRHKEKVGFWITWIIDVLSYRSEVHDDSKLKPPEREVFNEYTPLLKVYEFGSDEYKNALEKMGEGLKHHYRENAHHPEHYKNGIDGMTLWDLVEMVADWMAAASEKKSHMDMDYLKTRFGISDQLLSIIVNTLYAADMDAAFHHIPPDTEPLTNFLDHGKLDFDKSIMGLINNTDDVCTWRNAHDPEVGDYWISDCGLTWAFSFGGGPAENEWGYCPKCGKKLVEEDG